MPRAGTDRDDLRVETVLGERLCRRRVRHDEDVGKTALREPHEALQVRLRVGNALVAQDDLRQLAHGAALRREPGTTGQRQRFAVPQQHARPFGRRHAQ